MTRHGLVNLLGEPARFVRAALVDPVPRDHTEPASVTRHRRWVVAATLVVGATLLALSLRAEAADPVFYVAGTLLAVTWAAGAILSGPLHLGRAHTRSGHSRARPVVQPFVVGALLIGAFLAGALVVARVPTLREPVDAVLGHARVGTLPVVVGIAVANGLAEEVFFRGALFAAVGRRHAVLVTTVVYVLTTVATGNLMLVLAAAVLGLVTALQRRVTGGVLAPMVTHTVWTLGMLLLLPPVLDLR